MAPYFEIIIFTASISEYASTLIDMLDKDKLTSGRLFRQHCLFNHGLYLKDINILKKDLKDVIIIDNNPVSYVMNQDNGLPILTWYDDLNDKELLNFIPLLKYLASVDDVREVIKKIVDKQSNKIKFDIVDQLIENKIIENMKFKNINSQKNDNYERQNMNDIYRNNNNLNRNYNFKIKDHATLRFSIFLTVGLCGLLFSNIILYVCIDVMSIDKVVSKLLSIVLVVFFQFLINKHLTFKPSRDE